MTSSKFEFEADVLQIQTESIDIRQSIRLDRIDIAVDIAIVARRPHLALRLEQL